MPRVFNISSASDGVRLDTERSGDAVFTITNVSSHKLRGRFLIRILDPISNNTIKKPIEIQGDEERSFDPNGTQQVAIKVNIPASTPDGKYRFRLDAVSVNNPDEDFAEGPTLVVNVSGGGGGGGGGGLPWWKILVDKFWINRWWILVIVILMLTVGWLVYYNKTNTSNESMVEVPPVVGKPYKKADEQMRALGLKVERINQDNISYPVEQVIKQSPRAKEKVPKGSEVKLTISRRPAKPEP